VLRRSRSVTLSAGGTPESASDPERPAVANKGAKPVVDPSPGHAGTVTRSAMNTPSSGAAHKAAHSSASEPLSTSAPRSGCVRGGAASRGLWAAVGALGQGAERLPRQPWAQRRVAACRLGHGLVRDQVGASTAGRVLFGCGDQELAGRVQRVRLPPGRGITGRSRLLLRRAAIRSLRWLTSLLTCPLGLPAEAGRGRSVTGRLGAAF
jgi:hypothetical protein